MIEANGLKKSFGEIEAQVVDSNWLEDKFPEIQSMTYKCHIQ